MARRTYSTAEALEVVGKLAGFASVILGIVLIAQTDHSGCAATSSYCSGSSTHPWVVPGIATIIVGLVQATALVMITAYLRTRVVDFVGDDFEPTLGSGPVSASNMKSWLLAPSPKSGPGEGRIDGQTPPTSSESPPPPPPVIF
jgi:hypothetical protein